jgi:hypothetical protein
MRIVPFILRFMRTTDSARYSFDDGAPMAEDVLPAALAVMADGLFLSRDSKITEVKQETHDDQ